MDNPGNPVIADSSIVAKTVKTDIREEFRRGIRPLLGAFLGILLGVHILYFYSAGTLMPSLSTEFGWDRAQLSLAPTLIALVGTLSSPFVGRLVDRFSARTIAVCSMLLSALAFAALAIFTSSFTGYIAFTLTLALAGAGTTAVTYLSVVNRWFNRARGLAIGIVMAATGLTGALAPKLLMPIVTEHGWRVGYLVLASAVLLASPLMFLLLRDRDAYSAENHAGTTKTANAEAQWGMTLREAGATSTFWLLGLCFFLMTTAATGLVIHFVPMLIDQGSSPMHAANMAALIGLAIIVGRLLAGLMLDRIFASLVAAAFVLIAATGSALLAFGEPALTPLAALLLGLALGAEVDIAGYMTARYFGTRHYGAIYGCQYGIFAAGSILSPVAIGLLYDLTSGYKIALICSAALLVAIAPLLLTLGRYPAAPAVKPDPSL